MSDLFGNYKRPNAEKKVIEKFVKLFEKGKSLFKTKNYSEALEIYNKAYLLLNDIWDKFPKIITLYKIMKGYFYSKPFDKCKTIIQQLDLELKYIPANKKDSFIKIKSKILMYELILYFIYDDLDSSIDSVIGVIKYLTNHPTFDVEDKAKFFWNYIKSFLKITGITHSNKFKILKEGYNTMIVEQVNVNDDEYKNNENEDLAPVKKVNKFMMESYKTFMNSKLRGITYELLDKEFYYVKYGKVNDKVMIFLHKNINIFVRDNNRERLVELFHTFLVLNKMDLRKEYNMTLDELVFEQKRRIEAFDRIYSNLVGAFNHIFKPYFADEIPNLSKKIRRKSKINKTFKININELKNLIKVRIQSPGKEWEEDSLQRKTKTKKYLFNKIKATKEVSQDLNFNFTKEIKIPPNTEAMDRQILFDNYITRRNLLRSNYKLQYSNGPNKLTSLTSIKNFSKINKKNFSLRLPHITNKNFLKTERTNNDSKIKTLKSYKLKLFQKKNTESELENSFKTTDRKSNDFILRNINNYLITKILDIFLCLYNLKHNIPIYEDMDLSSIYPRKIDIFDFNVPNYINSYGFISIKGNQSENQDSYFYYDDYFLIKNLTLFGVCDGHGKNGKQISDLVSILFPSYFYYILLDDNLISRKIDINKSILKLIKIQESPDDIKHMFLLRYFFNKFEIDFSYVPFISKNQTCLFNEIHESLYYSHKELKRRYEIDITNSGTTLCSGFIYGNILYIINVGDSRAILGTFNDRCNKWKTTQLSNDHRPKNPEENKRIIANNGRVDRFKNEFGEDYGPFRVVGRENESTYPGLAMSRSIGDEDAKKLGVTYEPEVIKYELKSNDKIIIIGSDGLWEHLSNEEVIKIVGNCMNNDIKCEEAATILIDTVRNKVINNDKNSNKSSDNSSDYKETNEESKKYLDNITCIIIYLDIK